MKVSLNWIKEFTDIKLTTDEIIERIGAQIAEVETVEYLEEKYQGVVVGQITEAEDHPDADKLGKYSVKIGTDTVSVVAGDKTLKVDDLVAYIAPGVIVPETRGTQDEFIVETRELRGQQSNGMLASAKELEFSDEHEGVLVLDIDAKPGDQLTKYYGLDDVIVEVENKALTHRPDCFGIIGFAREIAGIQGLKFETPKWFTSGEPKKGDGLPLSVLVNVPEACPRFTAQSYKNAKIKASSPQVQSMLNRIGIRPINNVVDLTNYMMVLTGQPFHAFDYDEVAKRSKADGAAIVVRYPNKGEKIDLLDDRQIEPHEKAAMVATDSELLSVGGSIGGAQTEVSEKSKNIILEAANWDLYSIRGTSMKHGIFTEAVTRFSRGQDPNMSWFVQIKAAELLKEWSGAEPASALVDDYPEKRKAVGLAANSSDINSLLGTNLSVEEMATLLGNVEFDVNINKQNLDILSPTWRADINIWQDVAEEVGRLYGYDKIQVTLPFRTVKPIEYKELDVLQDRIRGILAGAGATEQLSYNFISEKMAVSSGYDLASLYKLRNALSPELTYLRPALLPSLLDNVYSNHRQGFYSLALFEINKAHSKSHIGEDSLPHERRRLGFVFSADKKTAKNNFYGAPFYQAKQFLTILMNDLNIDYSIADDSSIKHFEDLDSVFLGQRTGHIMVGDSAIGKVGEFSDSIHMAMKVPLFAAGFEIDLEALEQVVGTAPTYQALSKYPSTQQDITLEVPVQTKFSDIQHELQGSIAREDMNVAVEPLDVYQSEKEEGLKNVSYRLHLQHHSKTLQTSEVNEMLDVASKQLADTFSAKRI